MKSKDSDEFIPIPYYEEFNRLKADGTWEYSCEEKTRLSIEKARQEEEARKGHWRTQDGRLFPCTARGFFEALSCDLQWLGHEVFEIGMEAAKEYFDDQEAKKKERKPRKSLKVNQSCLYCRKAIYMDQPWVRMPVASRQNPEDETEEFAHLDCYHEAIRLNPPRKKRNSRSRIRNRGV